MAAKAENAALHYWINIGWEAVMGAQSKILSVGE